PDLLTEVEILEQREVGVEDPGQAQHVSRRIADLTPRQRTGEAGGVKQDGRPVGSRAHLVIWVAKHEWPRIDFPAGDIGDDRTRGGPRLGGPGRTGLSGRDRNRTAVVSDTHAGRPAADERRSAGKLPAVG